MVRILLFKLLTVVTILNLYSQSSYLTRFPVVKSTANVYSKYESVGTMENGLKTGLWIDFGSDSAIYRIGEYHKGIPVGEWSVNYPDGTIRKKTSYDSLGHVLCWERYFNKTKLIAISTNSTIQPDIYKSITNYEQSVFDCEQKQFQSSVRHTRDNYSNSYSYMYYDCDVENAFDKIIRIFLWSSGNYMVSFWNSNGTVRKEYVFQEGIETDRYLYEYAGKRLKKKRIYQKSVLIKMELYNKTGQVSKVKTY